MQQIYVAAVPYIVFGLLVLVAIFLFPPIADLAARIVGELGRPRSTGHAAAAMLG
jgi:hypothetical protein